MMKLKSKKLLVNRDSRGKVYEILNKELLKREFAGQVFISTALKGKTKGKHYHKRKTEWYLVLKGRGRMTLMDNASKKKVILTLDERYPRLILIPPNFYHEIKNIGSEEMYLLVYVDEVFDPNDPDTFYDL